VKKAGIRWLGIAVAPRLHHYTQKRLLTGAEEEISCEVKWCEESRDWAARHCCCSSPPSLHSEATSCGSKSADFMWSDRLWKQRGFYRQESNCQLRPI